MQLHLALIAILAPILLIEWPTLRNGVDMGISGTYDVLLFSLLLPRDQVLKLLPSDLRSPGVLLPVPNEVLTGIAPERQSDEGEEVGTGSASMHPVLLQMGYQISTGPGPGWLPKFSFNECKLEVPYVRHPLDNSSEPYAFKQHILFSNPVIKMGSQATGLRSSTAQFAPPATPSHAPEGSAEIRYTASNFLNATAKGPSGSSTASWGAHRAMLESWWFGGGTADVVQKFTFDWDNAPIKPQGYNVDIELNLAAFAEPGSDLGTTTARGQGWRTRVTVKSASRKL